MLPRKLFTEDNSENNNDVSIERWEIPPFEAELFYIPWTEDSGEIIGFRLTENGVKLVIDYYRYRYQIDITTVVTAKPFVDFQYFISATHNKLSAARQKNEEHREAFILMNSFHATPILYIKEYINEELQEGLFINDSISSYPKDLKVLKSLLPDIHIYVLSDARQSDNFSCYTDALIMCRDMLLKDEKNPSQFRLSHFLASIKKDAVSNSLDCYDITLLDELLKTVQRKHFLSDHATFSERPVHKNLTLFEFREKYSKLVNDKKKSIYLHIKGERYTRIIQMQYYLNHLQERLGSSFDDPAKQEFIAKAKSLLKENFSRDLLAIANETMVKIADTAPSPKN